MSHPRSSRSLGRIVAAAGLVIGALCWLASTAVSPAWADDSGAYIAEVAASPGRHVASGLLFLAGAIAFFPGFLAVVRLLRGPRGLVGQIGASMLAVGALVGGGLVLAVSVFEATIAESGLSRAQMIALSDASEESTGAMVAFVLVFLGGFVAGLVLLGVGLAIRRAVPLWTAGLVLVPVVLLFVAGDGKTGSVVGMAVLAAAFAALAWRIVSIPQAQWERPQPLGAPDRRGSANEQLQPA